MRLNRPEIAADIRETGKLNDAMRQALASAIAEFNKTFAA
jgi:hypothetical protein